METIRFILENNFASSKETAEVINPYSGKTVRKVYKSSKDDVNSALNYLASCFVKFRSTPSYLRAEILEKVSDKLSEQKEDIARLISLETGKPIKFARIETERAVFTFKTGSEEARRIEGEIIPLDQLRGSENKKGYIRRFPLGVILGITPWNFPVNLVAHKLAPAIASGNTVLLKPASASLCSGIEIGRLVLEACRECGLDYTSVNVVTSSGGEVEKFIGDERVKMVSFTGSPLVGWGIKRKLSRQKISLELGGNAGVIIDESADLNTAVPKIITGAFAIAGQSCISVQRVFVHEKIYDDFEKLIIQETAKVKYGDPSDENTVSGPMINETEAKRAEQWINEAVKEKGRILTGGKRLGAVLQPTVIADAPSYCSVNSKEVFAPVLTLKKFSDFGKAVEELDNSDYGLQAGVFTENLKHAFYAYENIEAGGVIINDVPTYRMDSMPYGGVKMSGMGKEGIRYAIEEMTERRILVV